MVDADRLTAAYGTAHSDLLAECDATGRWVGQLASSPLSTATAVSALALVERHAPTDSHGCFADESRESRLSQLLMTSVHWLARRQNPDGGWGDTDKSLSNIATTMLVRAAFQFTGAPAEHENLLESADAYIARAGGVRGLRRRYGRDKTFAAPILANLALAELVPWRDVPSLPFELAALPERFWRRVQMPVVSYAIPALVAVGQVKFRNSPPWNPLLRWIRHRVAAQTLDLLQTKQPDSGGYLEAIPLTSFVVMSLVGMGKSDHPTVARGVQFLLRSVRPDGSWPIDVNLAVWNSTLSINALAASGEDVSRLGCLEWLLGCQGQSTHPYTGADPGAWAWTDLSGGVPDADDTAGALLALDHWRRSLLDSEGRARPAHGVDHRGHAAGESGSTDRSLVQPADGQAESAARAGNGAGDGQIAATPPDAASTVAHAVASQNGASGFGATDRPRLPDSGSAADPEREAVQRIAASARRGIEWLLNLQNSDGGWPTFCRGWGRLPFDRSGADLTAHALRAFGAWRTTLCASEALPDAQRLQWAGRMTAVLDRGFDYLQRSQRPDGSWVPLWFGNQSQADECNPVYGTARVLLAYSELGRLAAPAAEAGLHWLVKAQNADGGWGGFPPDPAPPKKARKSVAATSQYVPPLPVAHRRGIGPSVQALFGKLRSSARRPETSTPSAKIPRGSSVEETALAVEAILCALAHGGKALVADKQLQSAADRGANWLIDAVEANRHGQTSPIGFYFAKLWYYERLYPLIFTVAALGQAVRRLLPTASKTRPSAKPPITESAVGNR